jgi:RNA polymerase sigma-70 factor (ECF subfamily)
LLRQQDAAEDVLQETYLAIWRTAGQYQPGRAPVLVWLMAIARHRAIELLRQRRRRAAEIHAESLAEEALQIPDPQPAQSIDHLAHAIQECLRRLSADQSQAIGWLFSTASATRNWRRGYKPRSARSKAGYDGVCCN